MNVADAVQSVLDRLHTGGVRAVNDERDINPPCVFLSPPVVDFRFARGDFTAEFTAYVITGAAGRSVDLVNLGAQLTTVSEAMNWAGVRAEPADLLVPQQAAPLPSYRLTWSERIRQP